MFGEKPIKNNVMSYHGPFSLNLVSYMGNYMKTILDADKPITSKLFRVFIELVQNVSFYSAQTRDIKNSERPKTGVGWFKIDEDSEAYQITTGNAILKEHVDVLADNCKEINRLDEIELRELKRKTRSQADIKDVGAHIGLIHTGLISGNPINVEIKPVNEILSFFTINVKIDK